jgi:hypothetical protein
MPGKTSKVWRVKTKIETLQKDVAMWESTTLGADYPEGE